MINNKYLYLFFLFFILFLNCGDNKKIMSTITILNSTEISVDDFNVDVCKQKIMFGSVKPGVNKTLSFSANYDSEYNISFKHNSKIITKNKGYVTNGMLFSDTIIVKLDTIILRTATTIP